MTEQKRITIMGAGAGDYVSVTFDSLNGEQPVLTGWVRPIPLGVVEGGTVPGVSLSAAQEGRALGIRLAGHYWVPLSHGNIAEVKVLRPGPESLWKPEPIRGNEVVVDKDGILIPAYRESEGEPWHMPSRGLWFENDTDLRVYADGGAIDEGPM